MRSRPLYPRGMHAELAALRRDVEMLKRRVAPPESGVGGGGGGFDPNTALALGDDFLHVDAAIFPDSDYWESIGPTGGYVACEPPALPDPFPGVWAVPVLHVVSSL